MTHPDLVASSDRRIRLGDAGSYINGQVIPAGTLEDREAKRLAARGWVAQTAELREWLAGLGDETDEGGEDTGQGDGELDGGGSGDGESAGEQDEPVGAAELGDMHWQKAKSAVQEGRVDDLDAAMEAEHARDSGPRASVVSALADAGATSPEG